MEPRFRWAHQRVPSSRRMPAMIAKKTREIVCGGRVFHLRPERASIASSPCLSTLTASSTSRSAFTPIQNASSSATGSSNSLPLPSPRGRAPRLGGASRLERAKLVIVAARERAQQKRRSSVRPSLHDAPSCRAAEAPIGREVQREVVTGQAAIHPLLLARQRAEHELITLHRERAIQRARAVEPTQTRYPN